MKQNKKISIFKKVLISLSSSACWAKQVLRSPAPLNHTAMASPTTHAFFERLRLSNDDWPRRACLLPTKQSPAAGEPRATATTSETQILAGAPPSLSAYLLCVKRTSTNPSPLAPAEEIRADSGRFSTGASRAANG